MWMNCGESPWTLTPPLFDLLELIGNLEIHGFRVIETVQRNPHPEVEYQSIHGYTLAQREGG